MCYAEQTHLPDDRCSGDIFHWLMPSAVVTADHDLHQKNLLTTNATRKAMAMITIQKPTSIAPPRLAQLPCHSTQRMLTILIWPEQPSGSLGQCLDVLLGTRWSCRRTRHDSDIVQYHTRNQDERVSDSHTSVTIPFVETIACGVVGLMRDDPMNSGTSRRTV